MRSVVVFPQPLGPSSVKVSPALDLERRARRRRETCRIAWKCHRASTEAPACVTLECLPPRLTSFFRARGIIRQFCGARAFRLSRNLKDIFKIREQDVKDWQGFHGGT